MLQGTFKALIMAVALIANAGDAAASTKLWSAVKDFTVMNNTGANPQGQWSYSANGTLLNVPKSSVFGINGLSAYWNGQNSPISCTVFRNYNTTPVGYLSITLPPDHLSLDPEAGYVTVAWSAPAAGKYSIVGDFLGVDHSEHVHFVQIDVIGQEAPLFITTISSYGQRAPFTFTVTLAKKQTVEFTVQAGGDYYYLSTGLAAQISAVP